MLNGLPAMRPAKWKRLGRWSRTIRRSYGGVLSHQALRERIVRSFLGEELKIVKKHERVPPSKQTTSKN